VRPLSLSVDLLLQSIGGHLGRALPSIDARVADVPNTALLALAGNALVQKLALDRTTIALNERTSATVGATAVRNTLGYDGQGIGVAIIDSGVVPWHDDLTSSSGPGPQRIAQYVDFVNGQSVPSDTYGHGTHVAGIIAGNGFDSAGARSGIAPRARLVVLKVLDGSGAGRISNVIAALEYAVSHKAQYNIRVVNLSIAAAVHESYNTDFLAQATRRAVEAGLVVVAAAGNNGKNANGYTQYGAITAPGNAPWVLTVGASSHMGTVDRADDTMALFSSRGPTRYDYTAKPDLVAPGVGIESLSAPGSALYSNYSAYLLPGTVATANPPYLSLSGTSMAAPVVAGSVALMLEANPALTPNAVKAILQYTAQVYPAYDWLTEGAGFLNTAGAVTLARYFSLGGDYPADPGWGQQIIWANHRVQGGRIQPNVNAWGLTVQWGSTAVSGAPAVWGDAWSATTNAWTTWSTTCVDLGCGNVTWAGDWPNVVWGSQCGGSDCAGTAWSTSDSETVVWGTSGSETVVWGTNDSETVVWGTNGDETVVWGTGCGQDCQPVIWNP
jgi:serine protease AprX